MDAKKRAGMYLKYLIQTRFSSQQAFADDYGADIRTVSRYINQGIASVDTLQELAYYWNVDIKEFFMYCEKAEEI